MSVSPDGLSPLAQAMWASPAVAVALLEGDGVIAAANPMFERLAGRDPVGEPFSAFVCKPHRPSLEGSLNEMNGTRGSGCIGMFPDAEGNLTDVTLTITKTSFIEVMVEPQISRPMGMLADVVALNELLASNQRDLDATNEELQASLDAIKESHLYIRKLEGILPICMNCKSVRDDSDTWTGLDSYLVEREAVSLSHSLCPHCAEKFLKEEGVS